MGLSTRRRELRQEKAKLLGFPTFAHLSMASKVRFALESIPPILWFP